MIQIPLKISPRLVRSLLLRNSSNFLSPISTTDGPQTTMELLKEEDQNLQVCCNGKFPPAGKRRMTNCFWCVTCSLTNDPSRSSPPPPSVITMTSALGIWQHKCWLWREFHPEKSLNEIYFVPLVNENRLFLK